MCEVDASIKANGHSFMGTILWWLRIVNYCRVDVGSVTVQWVNWYNNQRLLEPIGNIPPVEFEAVYYEQENGQAIAA
jgi:hypothetical protein